MWRWSFLPPSSRTISKAERERRWKAKLRDTLTCPDCGFTHEAPRKDGDVCENSNGCDGFVVEWRGNLEWRHDEWA